VALSRLAERLEEEGSPGDAAALYKRVVTINPRSLDAWAAGIEAFLSAALPEDALRMADDGLLLFPGYVPLRVLRARSLVGARRIEEAVALISELRENDLSASDTEALDALMERIEAM
jgi:hypothetical protein